MRRACAHWFPRTTVRDEALIFSIFSKNYPQKKRFFLFFGKFRKSGFHVLRKPGNMRKHSAKRVSPVARLGVSNANCASCWAARVSASESAR